MDTDNQSPNKEGQARRSVLDLSCDQARGFFLKPESYCTIDFPPYFVFKDIIDRVYDVLKDTPLSCLRKGTPRGHDGVNHLVMHSKDGRYAWRALELIHPALYVSLVNSITKPCYWEKIQQRFRCFNANDRINCLSIPVEALTDEKDKAEQIKQWWQEIEQKSIELSLEYEIVVHTDVIDCYADIYTHSIAWAIHGKRIAKQDRLNKHLIGNIIDIHIQDMRDGQTNGIPQGSVLMDFIAEMVLGYADSELMERIDCQNIEDYKILRYRDDYRIFVNNTQDAERIMKCLTEVMIELGMKLSPQKTETSSDVIRASIKSDKLSWTFRKQRDANLQKHLLIIHDHCMRNPNSGSLHSAMDDFLRRFDKRKSCRSAMPLISIVVDIACRSPRVYPVAAALLSRLIRFLESDAERVDVLKKIRRRFARLPNTEHMQTWIQRISYPFDRTIDYDTPLCSLVLGRECGLWNSGWISSKDLLDAIDQRQIIDAQCLAELPGIITPEEFALYSARYQ